MSLLNDPSGNDSARHETLFPSRLIKLLGRREQCRILTLLIRPTVEGRTAS